jgi:hypothetical protein
MKVTCLQCGHSYDVSEGADVAKIPCPACATPQGAHFPYAKSVRFEAVDHPAYLRACEHARRGDADGALAALEEAFRSGYDDFERPGADPALAGLRSDPRLADLVRRYRSR